MTVSERVAAMTGWEIVLLVWVGVIPTMVLALGWVSARRRQRHNHSLADAEGVPYGAVIRSISSASGVRPAPEPRLRVERTR
jgi:hypothetical protein